MAKKTSEHKNNSVNKYNDINKRDCNISNSILVVNNNVDLKLEIIGKLYLYYVILPVNIPLTKTRKAYQLKEKRMLDFLNSDFKNEINKIYNFDNPEKFCFLKSSDIENKMNCWFTNGQFPSIEEITSERICIKNTYGLGSKIPGLFDFVRNCLCHGNFEVIKIGKKDLYLVLEDCESSTIRGRGTIKIETLISIAEYIIK